MLILTNFAERLNELMIENDIKSPELATKLGIHRSTISRYLSGNKIPSVKNVISLANYFNCSTDYLLSLTDENKVKTFKPCPPFNEQLKFLLDYYKITKYQLQKWTQIAESSIYYWQRKKSNPDIDSIIRIAKCLECSVDFVLGR